MEWPVIVKASGSVALANQDIQDSWQWLASGFSGSVIQEFKIGPGGGVWRRRNGSFLYLVAQSKLRKLILGLSHEYESLARPLDAQHNRGIIAEPNWLGLYS